MENAIKKAIEGGLIEGKDWKFVRANTYWAIWLNGNGNEATISVNNYLLDPTFWQALGLQQGWRDKDTSRNMFWTFQQEGNKITLLDEWENQMQNFIYHITQGRSIDEFFNNLLK